MPVQTGIQPIRCRGGSRPGLTWIPACAGMTESAFHPVDKFRTPRLAARNSFLNRSPPAALLNEQFLDLFGHFRRLLDDVDGGFLQLLTAQGRDFDGKLFRFGE